MKELTMKKLIIVGLATAVTGQAYAFNIEPVNSHAVAHGTQVQQYQMPTASDQYIQLEESGSILSLSPGTKPNEPPKVID